MINVNANANALLYGKREKMLFFSKCEQHFAREIRARLENLNVSDKTELTLYQISNQLN